MSASTAANRLNKTIVMVGMMGSGKTAIGRALAARLSVPFLDSDEEIVSAAQQSIADIFERDGEDFFRQREAEVIRRLLSGPAGILSTGGGAFLQEQNREAIIESGASVWLDADLALLWERVRGKDTRPLLRTPDPKATLAALLAARIPHYAHAELRLPIRRDASIEETTDDLVALLKTRPDILETLP